MGLRILAFDAHTGDIEITAGGTILANTADGGKCLIVHMFRPSGRWARPPDLSVEEYAELRFRQALDASRKLGAEVHFVGCIEGAPYDSDEVEVKMYKAIVEFAPDVILVHWKGSYHPDHLACHLHVIKAFERAKGELGTEIVARKSIKLYYPENWEDPQGFQPEVYVDISDFFDEYVNVLKTYDFTTGKYSGFNYVDYYTCLKRVRGLEVGSKYAEAYMTFGDWGIKRVRCRGLPSG